MPDFLDLSVLTDITLTTHLLLFTIALFAGIVKGAVGFALPMILISGLSAIIDYNLALAALIFATLVTNLVQALRQGRAAAHESLVKYWRLIVIIAVMILISAQLVVLLPKKVMLGLIGVPVALFALSQLMGKKLVIPTHRMRLAEAMAGGLAGFFGGFSGIWGPPTVAYLTALHTEKSEQVRVQGIVYGIGAVALTLAHLRSGVLNGSTAVLSAWTLVPVYIGLIIGNALHDRMDQKAFKKVTLVILLIAALNLVRKAFF